MDNIMWKLFYVFALCYAENIDNYPADPSFSSDLYQVRLNNNELAEIYQIDKWIPICGHWFWNNNKGATLFCQQLGYKIGIVKQESIARQVPLPDDGFRIGECETNDIWGQCTGGCNDHTIGGTHCSDCRSGAMAGLRIACSNAANANEHVNNLLQSTTDTTPDWEINVESGKWAGVFFNQGVDDICGPQWYGWNGGAEVGSISTMLYKSSKCGKLDFGNCWDAGTVRAYLAGELIGEAGPNTPSQIIEFAIPENSQLEFKDEGANSVIKFTNFEMVDCTTTTGEGDVRLVDGKFPEVFLNEIWSPICGHWFWDNDFGASLFCQKLTSDPASFGYVIRRTDKPLEKDAIRIGKCLSNDQWLSCSGGSNDLGTGQDCDADSLASIEIECHIGGTNDWCARLYGAEGWGGWEKEINETNQLDLTGYQDNSLSSWRVYPGCTLTVFEEHNNVGFLASSTVDVRGIGLSGYNDKVSSLSCTCQGSCYDDEIVPQEGKFCTNAYAYLAICDGSKTDCVSKGKEKCNSDQNCHGIMYHPGWSNLRKGVQVCTSKTLIDKPEKDWFVYLKCDEGTTTPTTTPTPTPTQTPTPTPTPTAGCEDNWPTKKCNKKCKAKKCLKSKSCKKNCRNTCDLCGIEEPCEDQKSSKFCKKALSKGKCGKSSIWKKCKKTCDKC